MPLEVDVRTLTPREHVRLRPGMYIGGTDQRALHHMVYEVLQEPVVDVFAGKCDHLEVVLLPQNIVLICDNSPGLPIDYDPQRQTTIAELWVTRIGYDQKYLRGKPGYFTPSMFGVGIACVNCLSSAFTAEIRRDGFLWRLTCREGLVQGGLQQIRPLKPDESTGTMIIFQPDYSILEPNEFDYAAIALRCRELAYHCAGLKITLRDERTTPAHGTVFHAKDGLAGYIRELADGQALLHEPIRGTSEISTADSQRQETILLGVEFAFAFTDSDEEQVLSYINTVQTVHGGSHIAGFKATLLALLNGFAEDSGYSRQYDFAWSEISRGLVAVVSVRHPNPAFGSPTRAQLLSPEAYSAVARVVFDAPKQGWLRAIRARLLARRGVTPTDDDYDDF